MNTALIVGIDSVIGKRLEHVLNLNGWTVFGTSRRACAEKSNVFYLDLANIAKFRFDLPIDVVFLCASITKITLCKDNNHHAKLINVDAQIQLAEYFSNKNTHIVYLSSNAVFNGQKPWYKTTDPLCPTTSYGEYKALVEKALLQMNGKVTIVRLTKVLTPNYPLVVQWTKNLRNNKIIEPFYNLFLSPISINTVSQCLKEIGDKHLSGIIHLSGESDVSYVEFAEYLTELINLKKGLIKGIAMLDSNNENDQTPLYTSLDMTESKQLFTNLDTSFATTMNGLYGDLSK